MYKNQWTFYLLLMYICNKENWCLLVMKLTFLNLKKINFYLILILSIFLSNPVHAYAGPGVAIGAIIVFLTVIITFFASFFISIFNFLKNNLFKNKNKQKIKEKSKNKQN